MKPMASDIALFMPASDMGYLLMPLGMLPMLSWPKALWKRFVFWLYLMKWQWACFMHGGHTVVKKAWVNALTGEVGEYHCGCSRCTLFWTEAPDGTRTSEPRMMYLGE